MKETKRCPKCDSQWIGHLDRVCYRDDDLEGSTIRPLTAGLVELKRGAVLLAREAVGELEAFLCSDCGYYELYVKDLSTVPLEDLDGFSWVCAPPPADGPYR